MREVRFLRKTYFSHYALNLIVIVSRLRRDLLLAVNFVRYGQLFAALCAASCQNATTICCQHALTETMLVVSLAVVRLECSFHCLILFSC